MDFVLNISDILGLDFPIKVPHIYLTHYYTLGHYAEMHICS